MLPDQPQPWLAGSALLTNAVGLHARPSVKLTQVAKRFAARIEFALDPAGPTAVAKSPVKVMRAKAAVADILGFQVALLEDAVLAVRAFAAITEGRAAHEAWLAALSAEAGAYEGSDDEYFRARVADVRDIRDRVLAHLTGSAAD